MWLLTTDRAELVLYREPPEVYAILSHVWRAEEQSFQELFAIIQECKAAGENPRDYVDDKIRKCCQWAEAHGFKLLWMDSCCIDKSSSAELSEAINSMFMWYKQATVCYAYLRDALAQESPSRPGSSFRQSKWFTRGWTLQELIAPRDVVFLSGNWQPLASKITAARLLEDITGIEAAVLRGRRSLDEVNVAKRMSWAAKRVTTRIEDQAYCLMGIFGVNLPTIYGEGSEAFIRLQEEIIRRTPDRTLLAWGPRHPLAEVVVGYRSSIFPTPQGERYIRESCLLARSPSEFASAGKMVSVPIQSLADTFGISVHRAPLTASSYGAHTMFPIIQFPNHCTLALLPCQEDGAFVALVLRFQGTHGPWSIGTRAHRSETLHVRHQYSSPAASRTGHPEVITHTREYPVRCVLIRDLNDLVWCMQHPLRQTETIPTPIWSPIFVAYRAQHVMVRSQVQLPKTWSRKSYVAPCKLIIPVWALTALEDMGYTLQTPLPSSFLDLVPGQMLSLVFSTPVTPGHWSAFAVHIGAEQPPGHQDSPRGLARRGSGVRPQTPLWCAVRFPRPERGSRSVFEQAHEWIGRELTASPPAPFGGLDMSGEFLLLQRTMLVLTDKGHGQSRSGCCARRQSGPHRPLARAVESAVRGRVGQRLEGVRWTYDGDAIGPAVHAPVRSPYSRRPSGTSWDTRDMHGGHCAVAPRRSASNDNQRPVG